MKNLHDWICSGWDVNSSLSMKLFSTKYTKTSLWLEEDITPTFLVKSSLSSSLKNFLQTYLNSLLKVLEKAYSWIIFSLLTVDNSKSIKSSKHN